MTMVGVETFQNEQPMLKKEIIHRRFFLLYVCKCSRAAYCSRCELHKDILETQNAEHKEVLKMQAVTTTS